MIKVWLVSDTHWHQDAERIHRPADHTLLSLVGWRRVVMPDDIVIHLGDVTWKPKLLEGDLAQLPGRKVLVRGNHDRESLTWYMRHGFDFACDSMVFKGVLLTHEPAPILPIDASLNVHGHLHDNEHRVADYEPRPFHRLLAIERTNYEPVEFGKFTSREGAARPRLPEEVIQ
jgi:calcineurin-like phosphoesterase family protein